MHWKYANKHEGAERRLENLQQSTKVQSDLHFMKRKNNRFTENEEQIQIKGKFRDDDGKHCSCCGKTNH